VLKIDSFKNIYLFRPFVDFRKSIDGLSLIVESEMKLDPFSNYLFIFGNRKKDKLKVLYWDKTGFALWYKRLEEDKYIWPVHHEQDNVILKVKELEYLLDGLNPWQLSPHKELKYKKCG